ncbi:hypothetical protein BGZ98_004511 [Dissophora globulifera]|nr:hypothetical protein BGZ98_004511 [Dissophora globulifera]
MPVRWSMLGLLLLFLIALLLLSKVSFTLSSTHPDTTIRERRRTRSATPSSALLLHRLQEEQHLRNRNAEVLQELEENDLQLELDCATPPSAADISSQLLSRDERSLQEADFELELEFEVQRLLQRHQYDSTLLNESPSALQRHIERKLRYQKHLMSAYRASLHQQAALSYSSQECVSWRAKQLGHNQRDRSFFISSAAASHVRGRGGDASKDGAMTVATALARFQQFHPNRRDLDPNSIFFETLKALAQKQYSDPNGFVVELDPAKVMAGSRRASTYQNDDIHVLVLDMQWDPEVTVVVGNVLDETVKLRQEGYRPVMLNVGDEVVPGGDYHLDTATNNEADLFRRTTLHQCLDQEPRRSKFYPLSETGGVYCPNQAVFRHGTDRNNEFMDRFEWISVVSVAPIPKLETREKDGGLGGVQFLEGEDDMLRRKILAAMKVGVSEDVGQNPAEAIAAIYRSIIGRDFMGGRKRFQTYKKIIMVLDPEYAYRIVNETSSYRPLQPLNVTATPLPSNPDAFNTEDGDDSNNEDDNVDQERVDPENTHENIMTLARRSVQDLDMDSSDLEQEDQEEEEGEQFDVEQFARDEAIKWDNRRLASDDNEDEQSEDEQLDEEQSEDEQSEDEQSEDDIELVGGRDEMVLNGEELTGEEADENEVEEDDQLLVDQLAPEDEVSESEALLEEQDLEEEAELSGQALDEDLSDIPLASENQDDNESGSENLQGSNTDDESFEEMLEEDDGSSSDDQDELAAPEEFVPITETVLQVFERMLESRSLLLIKNRARGLLEEVEVIDTVGNSTNSTELQQPSASEQSSLPTGTVA